MRYLVVAQHGVQLEESLPSRCPGAFSDTAFDLALDGQNRPHLIVGTERLRREAGKWMREGDIPCSRFARGSGGLFCSFIIDGQAAGVRGEWQLFVVAPILPGLLPSYYTPRLVAVARLTESGDADGVRILELNDDYRVGTQSFAMASESERRVHVYYLRAKRKSLQGVQDISEWDMVYADLDFETPVAESTGARIAVPGSDREVAAAPASGIPIESGKRAAMPTVVPAEILFNVPARRSSLAIDPATRGGVILANEQQTRASELRGMGGDAPRILPGPLVTARDVAGGDVAGRLPLANVENGFGPRIAGAGNGRYHAVIETFSALQSQPGNFQYLFRRDGEWFGPVWLDDGAPGYPTSVDLAASPAGPAIAVWVDDKRTLVARWIMPKP